MSVNHPLSFIPKFELDRYSGENIEIGNDQHQFVACKLSGTIQGISANAELWTYNNMIVLGEFFLGKFPEYEFNRVVLQELTFNIEPENPDKETLVIAEMEKKSTQEHVVQLDQANKKLIINLIDKTLKTQCLASPVPRETHQEPRESENP